MDIETPARKALAAIGANGKRVTGLPDEYPPQSGYKSPIFTDIEITIGWARHPPELFMEYEDSAGCYHHRVFEIDIKTMHGEGSDDVILRPQRRIGDPFVEFFEEHGPFDVRR